MVYMQQLTITSAETPASNQIKYVYFRQQGPQQYNKIKVTVIIITIIIIVIIYIEIYCIRVAPK